jgi:hypothetical protein
MGSSFFGTRPFLVFGARTLAGLGVSLLMLGARGVTERDRGIPDFGAGVFDASGADRAAGRFRGARTDLRGPVGLDSSLTVPV